ncbi:hypothetical protein HYFRA_00005656 [Hymenoscyphus fraxineus]|uniref:Glycoside hydrolase family 2 protein n=1 Tax=Hymenoscyphus fraxineus TaxID=746836 RepID=A0A9N9KUP1_9HELO|nr:hypothetical protein HYFRA_00005656 [Hymenoscyphus fraxineus]
MANSHAYSVLNGYFKLLMQDSLMLYYIVSSYINNFGEPELVLLWTTLSGFIVKMSYSVALPVVNFAAELFNIFANPAPEFRPMFRWWWPHGLVSATEISAEIDEIADAGFGGVEIEDVHHSIKDDVLDPLGHGWATTPWTDAVIRALEQAKKRNLRTDIAVGPSWPASLPTITPDDDAAAKELVHGRAYLNATNDFSFSGPLPVSFQAPAPGVINETLISVQAWRINPASKPSDRILLLDSDTMIDLTTQVINGNLTWRAPTEGSWILMPFRIRGTGQLPEAGPHTSPPSYVIDHFSPLGAKAITQFWDSKILNTGIKGLGSLFEDSLEFEATTYWTPNFPSEFSQRMGYDILPLLPSIVREKEKFTIAFSDQEISRGVLNDFWDVLGDLYIRNHIKPMQSWSQTHDITLRVQPYGLQTDAMGAAASLDIAEGESLGFKNLDDYRSLAGGSNMGQKPLISNEAAAFATSAYTTTWERVLRTLNPIFSTGVNQNVLHGFSYKEAPGVKWPGFAAFTPYNGAIGYAESWGPRQPAWRHAGDIAAYLGRVQLFLRRGVAKHDVGFFRQKGYVASGFGASWFSSEGVRMGWSMNFLAPSLLRVPISKVSNRRLASEGPDFGMLAFEGDAFASLAPVLSLDTMRRLLDFAIDGLPVLVVGNWTGVRAYGYGEFSKSPLIAEMFEEMLTLPNVVIVPDRATMAGGVARLGVLPAVRHTNSSLLHIRRIDGDLDHFFFVAASATEGVDQDVSIPKRYSQAAPYILDPWSGKTSPIPIYEELENKRLSFRIKLLPGQTMLVTLVPLDTVATHAVESTGQPVISEGGRYAIRAAQSGTYSTTFSNGDTVETAIIEDVPPAIDLKDWLLSIEDWRPGNTTTTTTILYHNLTLSSPLQPWTSFQGLEDVSGVGIYTTFFTSPSSTPTSSSKTKLVATLSFDRFLGSFRVWVNDDMVAADQLAMSVELGDGVKEGENKLVIEVAGSLLNRLRVEDPGVYGGSKRQDFGLIGVLRVGFSWVVEI